MRKMMSQQLIVMMTSAFALVLLTAFIILYSLDALSYEVLFRKPLFNLPLIVDLLVMSIISGGLFAMWQVMTWQMQLKKIEEQLFFIEQGKTPDVDADLLVEELASIHRHIQAIHKQMTETAKVSQRTATEKSIEKDKYVQEIISQERNRLARELHDSVSQQLFAASMMMSAITETAAENPVLMKQLNIVEGMIQQSQLEMRALLLHLRPIALKNKSLQDGMTELLTELVQKVPMQIRWKLEDHPLAKGVEDQLFRILQESMSNTLRHSKAETVDVRLMVRDQLVIFIIEDDGVGFDIEVAKAGSYGLQTMQERAAEVGGTMKIISVKGKGTRLEIKVPHVESEETA